MNRLTRSGRPTIADVARATGVSTATVSQILNGKGRASERTRAAVVAAAKRIGYDANPIARSLRTGRTGILGIIFRPKDAIKGSLLGAEYYVRVAGSAAAAALDRGYGLLHVPDPFKLGDASWGMDGCLVVDPFGSDPVLDDLQRRGMPVVSVDPDPDRPADVVWIGRDDREAIRRLLDHVADAGASRFALLLTDDDNAWKRAIRATFRSWSRRRAAAKWMIELPSDAAAEGARDSLRRLLDSGARPDAVIASTSRFATGAAEALRERGLDIPGDALVAVLADGELTRSHQPPITALDLHGETLGTEAVTRLINLVEGRGRPRSKTIQPTMRLRESTRGPLRRAG